MRNDERNMPLGKMCLFGPFFIFKSSIELLLFWIGRACYIYLFRLVTYSFQNFWDFPSGFVIVSI